MRPKRVQETRNNARVQGTMQKSTVYWLQVWKSPSCPRLTQATPTMYTNKRGNVHLKVAICQYDSSARGMQETIECNQEQTRYAARVNGVLPGGEEERGLSPS